MNNTIAVALKLLKLWNFNFLFNLLLNHIFLIKEYIFLNMHKFLIHGHSFVFVLSRVTCCPHHQWFLYFMTNELCLGNNHYTIWFDINFYYFYFVLFQVRENVIIQLLLIRLWTCYSDLYYTHSMLMKSYKKLSNR